MDVVEYNQNEVMLKLVKISYTLKNAKILFRHYSNTSQIKPVFQLVVNGYINISVINALQTNVDGR